MNKIISILRSKILESDIDDSVDFAFFLGEILSYNGIPFFDMSSIEEDLVQRLNINKNYNFLQDYQSEDDLFIVSEPYITGGHTRLMENLSLMIDGEKHLLITRHVDDITKKRLSNFFTSINTCYRAKGELSTEYIGRLVNELVKYNRLILNIHPDDIFTVIACGVAKKINKSLKVFFVNHADHIFTYGASVADYWFEISLYGGQVDELRDIKGERSFIGIPINKEDSAFFKKMKYPDLDNASNFVSAGSRLKYKPYKKFKIFPLLGQILKEKKSSSVNIIGANIFRDYWWWLPKAKFFNRLIINKSLPYEIYIKATCNADYYIDSHPMPGGTAFVEQFIEGVPCIGLKSDFFGYTPLECFKKKNITEIIEMLKNPPSEDEIRNIQERVFSVHGFSQVKKRFLGTIVAGESFSNPMLDYIERTEIRSFYGKKLIFSNEFFVFLYNLDKILLFKMLFITKPISILRMPFLKVYRYIQYR